MERIQRAASTKEFVRLLEQAAGEGVPSLAILVADEWIRHEAESFFQGRIIFLSGESFESQAWTALSWLGNMTQLTIRGLDIRHEGARALAHLTQLTSLDLAGNSIGDEGARALANLTQLTSLNLDSNSIGDEGVRAILDGFLRQGGTTLARLYLAGNPVTDSLVPREIFDSSDAQAILASYARFSTGRQKSLSEAKLLVVGDEAVGKTSLIRYLVKGAPRRKDEDKTPGAEIHERIETETWSDGQGGVTLNIWDFGGQEMLHGTHRFFLTKRSIYLLVLENRREDHPPIQRWMRTIRNLGGDSPVIVVVNKCDNGRRDLDLPERQLKAQYRNLHFHETSCNDDDDSRRSIEKLRKMIATILETDEAMRHVRDAMPEDYLVVKDRIRKLALEQQVVNLGDFEKICVELPQKVDRADEQRALLGLLHNLGVVVAYGLDVEAMSVKINTVLLDPNWLTQAVYTIIRHPLVMQQKGEFRRQQLGEILDPQRYPASRHEFVLAMMQEEEMGLCFALPQPERDCFLAPEALPSVEPEFEDEWKGNALRFRYQYQTLPSGLIPRLIVVCHERLSPKNIRWRNGVALETHGCSVMVRGEYGERDGGNIDIAVVGPENRRREALGAVRDYVEIVHKRYRECIGEPRVPLPDQPEVSVGYDYLLGLETRYGPEYKIHPERAMREYTVEMLLAGVETRRHSEREKAMNYITINIGPNVVFNGPLTVGNQLRDVYNQVSGSGMEEEKKRLMLQLTEEVAKVAGGLEERRAKDLSEDLKLLQGEVEKKEPRKKIWDVSAEGILSAAKMVGELGKTTLELMEKLGPLVGMG